MAINFVEFPHLNGVVKINPACVQSLFARPDSSKTTISLGGVNDYEVLLPIAQVEKLLRMAPTELGDMAQKLQMLAYLGEK